jgi:hypothetical protein
MPKIAVYKFLTFFIFAYDAVNEPPHLHIVKEKGNRQRSAKIWLETLIVAENGTLSEKEINTAMRLIKEHQQKFLQLFDKIKNGEKIRTLNLN